MTSKAVAPGSRSAGIDAPSNARYAARGTERVMLVQTQAEGAGAQEIMRILGHGLAARGYDVHHVFFFRRTARVRRISRTLFLRARALRPPFAIAWSATASATCAT